MRSIALGAAAAFVLAGVSMSSAATLHPVASVSAQHTKALTIMVPRYRGLGATRIMVPYQTGGATATPGTTATPVTTATPAVTDTPAPTATTGPSYPDAQTVFQNMINKLQLIKTMKFKEVTDGQQPGVDTLHVVATGVATCAGPGLFAHVTGKDTVEGTSQSTSIKYAVIQYKGKYYQKSKKTKNVWAAVKNANSVPPFAPDINAIMLCATSGGSSGGSGSGGSSNSCQIKDLANTGPKTVSGSSAWNITATEVCISSTGSEEDIQLGFAISQQSYLLLTESVNIDDTSQNIKLQFTRTRSAFGSKVSVSKPKIGSAKPK